MTTAVMERMFDYKGNRVRMVLIDGQPWFVAKDVCEALEFTNPSDIIKKRIDADEKGVYSIYTPTETMGIE